MNSKIEPLIHAVCELCVRGGRCKRERERERAREIEKQSNKCTSVKQQFLVYLEDCRLLQGCGHSVPQARCQQSTHEDKKHVRRAHE